MKFSTTDKVISQLSGNSLDLIHFDEIRPNSDSSLPAFILRGGYVKTITKFNGVDFFNLTVDEQEEKVQIWSVFISQLKTPIQVLVVSKPIQTEKYEQQVLERVASSKLLNKEVLKEIMIGLPQTLNYIKSGEAATFKKEYYIITSSTLRFSSAQRVEEDTKNEDETKEYDLGVYKEPTRLEWETFEKAFNEYYWNLFGTLNGIAERREDNNIIPLRTKEEIINLFADLNNDIPQGTIKNVEQYL